MDRLLLVVCMYDYTKEGRVPLLAISVYAASRCLTCQGVLSINRNKACVWAYQQTQLSKSRV